MMTVYKKRNRLICRQVIREQNENYILIYFKITIHLFKIYHN